MSDSNPNPNPNPDRAPAHVYVLMAVLAAAAGFIYYDGNQALTAALDDPAVVAKVVSSGAFRQAVADQADRTVAALDIETRVGESAGLKTLISESVSRHLAEYGSTSAFQSAVVSALPEQPQVDENASRLAQLQSKLDRYEAQLTDLANEVSDDDSAHQVNALQGQLVELRDLIGSLSDEVHCSLALPARYTSSFLLKEKRSTELRGHDLVITLGRIRKDVIDSVAISAPNADKTQADTKIVGNVRLGQPLEFRSGDHEYQGVFTYRQSRLGPDFIGFDVTRAAALPEGCKPGGGIAAL